MNLDHIIIIKAETDDSEGEWEVLHPAECVDGYSRLGVSYSCCVGCEVDANGIDAFALALDRDGTYLVGMEMTHHRSWMSQWDEIDVEVDVKELKPA